MKSPTSGVTPAPGDRKHARVLLVTSDGPYRERWQKVFAQLGWELGCAFTCGEAVQSLEKDGFPVVVYDCRAGGEDWREALEAIAARPDAPCVLLTSNVIDENFKDEVVRFHGYDVFSRHADDDEIVRTINSAWFWKHRHA